MAGRRDSIGLQDAPRQTVVVTDGMGHKKSYSTIGAALDSITDASESFQYVVNIGPGVYPEQVTLKSWAYMKGSLSGETIITSPAPTIQTSSPHTSLSTCSIQSKAMPGQTGALAAISVQGAPNTALGELIVTFTNASNAINLEMTALAIDTIGSSSTCAVDDCNIQVSDDGGTTATAVKVAHGAMLEMSTTLAIAIGKSASLQAVASTDHSAVELDWCTVTATTYALYCDDSGATMVAKDCKIHGPVSPNVKIINE
jgi:hypothetical protein